MMTNEEIATEVAAGCSHCKLYKDICNEFVCEDCSAVERYAAAMAACQYKDKQFINFLEERMGDEILVKTIEEFKSYIKKDGEGNI